MTATFATFETAGGARIFRLPLQAFPNFWAYAYVIQGNGLICLIDTGSGTETSHGDLLSGLNRAGLSPSDVTHILLTHAHIDHYGGLTKLKPLTKAKIGCHELDVQTVAHHEATVALITNRLTHFLTQAGLTGEEIESLVGLYRMMKAFYRSVPVDFTYNTIQNYIPAFDTIHLPGHCPGHVALRLDDVVFCGDMVVEGVTPHLAPGSVNPWGGLDRYLESLDKLEPWAGGARLVLNGHDEVISDLPAQIDATRKNIIRRMSKVVLALDEPLTIAEVCNIVYARPGGYNLFLTLEKTGAFLEYLYEHALIEIANPAELEQGLPAKYRNLRVIPEHELLPLRKSRWSNRQEPQRVSYRDPAIESI